MVTQGYYCNDEANRQNFTEDGWLRMGDVIQVKGDLLYVVGRTNVSHLTSTHLRPRQQTS